MGDMVHPRRIDFPRPAPFASPIEHRMTSPTDPHGAPPSPGPERPPPPPFFPRARAPRPPPVSAAVIGGSVALFVVDAVLSQGETLRGGLGPVFQWLALYGPLV